VSKILIADDDAVSLLILQNLLLKWDYEITLAHDGEEAFHILGEIDAPRLAVLDWMMPGMEGVEICRRIRERTDRPYIYTLLLTGRSEKEDLLQALKLGADDYLRKPVDAQELRARLHVGHRILKLQDNLLASQEELLFRATHDTLTGVYNRAAILDIIDRELSRERRENKPFAVILADLDHFKTINDTYGHLAGDSVLKEVAQRMVASLRGYDSVGRYGGEEFLMVAPGANGAVSVSLAERIRSAIESRPFQTDAGDVHVTASFGIAISEPLQSLEANTLLGLADKALYSAKENGRNRFELAVS
jgi:two-component system cell cycle response regulator